MLRKQTANNMILLEVILFSLISFLTCFRAVVHIQVKDVNEFSPAFKESMYKATVTEGKIYDSILQVEAIDEDCSPQYSQICNYEIVTTDVPFAIDRNGEYGEGSDCNFWDRYWYFLQIVYN